MVLYCGAHSCVIMAAISLHLIEYLRSEKALAKVFTPMDMEFVILIFSRFNIQYVRR